MKFRALFLSLLFVLLFNCCSESETPQKEETPPTTTFTVPNTEDIVMYEVNFSTMSSSKNIAGVTNQLDYIKSLGINTIWLMPHYSVGSLKAFGSPYCVKDYTAVNPSLGNLQDLKNLVSKAHEKNIAVIIDWVANHTSWDNPWISAHPNWYTKDSNGNIISPAGTGWNDVADLDYNNAEMRTAMISAMKFWIDNAGVDGFRCDAADYVPFDFWKQAITTLQSTTSKKLILLAEGNRADHFDAGFQMNFSWNFLSNLKNVFKQNYNVSNIYSSNNLEYSGVATGKKRLRFITNHDESAQASPISIFNGKDGALAANVIATYLQGVPLVYCGQELGVSYTTNLIGSATIDFTQNPDYFSKYSKILNHYSQSNPAKKGTLSTFSDVDICAFQKTYNAENLLVIVNTRNSNKNFSVPASLQATWTNALDNSTITLGSSLSLSPYQYYILKK